LLIAYCLKSGVLLQIISSWADSFFI